MADLITLAEAKAHLRVDSAEEDTLIAAKIVAAQEWVEDYTGLVLSRRPVTENVGSFTPVIKLRAWPIDANQPVTVAFRSVDGSEYTIAGSELRAGSRPGLLYPAAGTQWPLQATATGSVEVTFTAGYADAASIPQILKQAALVMLTAFYDDREGGELFAGAERSARGLCRRYRRRTL